MGRQQMVGLYPGAPAAIMALGKTMKKAEFVYGIFQSHL